MNIKLIISYKGTNYYGYQIQPNVKTVEGCLKAAIEKTVKHKVKLMSAGRTDTGVHAAGQVVNFFSNTSIDIGNLPKVINFHLPDDISVIGAEYVNDDFHSRFSAKGKHYRYYIYRGKYRNALYENMMHYPYPLDINKMEESFKCLIGEHDFKSFMGRHAIVKDTIREIYNISITDNGDIVYVDFFGKSFLKNMIRIIIGTSIQIGSGKFNKDHMEKVLKSKNRKKAGPTAPSKGLYLMEIYYD
ncbi:tRNA pseudouridine(38-40) synthase TruA [Peptoniphilus catoniae]|uniref:tRNA pseudouridine(38-40) synthase TruA n=1 Tax=Peptoniphilus catoniae TaxID=1660341 RepID=UPI0010FEBD24|nr:tRNA pseudouridine(38-40) synthase TruA [Peptoniphilus catoniae]